MRGSRWMQGERLNAAARGRPRDSSCSTLAAPGSTRRSGIKAPVPGRGGRAQPRGTDERARDRVGRAGAAGGLRAGPVRAGGRRPACRGRLPGHYLAVALLEVTGSSPATGPVDGCRCHPRCRNETRRVLRGLGAGAHRAAAILRLGARRDSRRHRPAQGRVAGIGGGPVRSQPHEQRANRAGSSPERMGAVPAWPDTWEQSPQPCLIRRTAPDGPDLRQQRCSALRMGA
jgi:hypothetical protein